MKIATAFLPALPIALNAEGAQTPVPDWVQLTPPGPVLRGLDGRAWRLDDPAAVVAACRAARGGEIAIPIDFEHATHVKGARGERADAAGWVRDLEVRGGAIWGRVEWNDAGREALTSRAYRFLSPGFDFDKATGQIRRLLSAGLTNLPNFTMPALNREQETPMDPDVLTELGLAPDAGADAVLAAIKALKAAEATALNRAEHPDPEAFVPRADYELALNRARQLEEEAAARREAEIAAEIDAAVAAGKIAPVSRDYHLAVCRAEGGLERFRAFIAAAPAFGARPAADPAGKGADKGARAAGSPALSPEELAVCRQMGLDPKDFAAARAAEQEF